MKKLLLLFIAITSFTFTSKSQCSMNCSDFCVLGIDNVDTTNNTLDVTIYSSDSACFVNYPVVIVTNSIGDTIANISSLFYFFGHLPGDTITHTIPTTVDSISSGFTGTVYYDDPTDSIAACSFSYPTACTVGINEHHTNPISFVVYPNPATTSVNINLNLNEIKNNTANITIYDVTGKTVKTVSTTERTLSIDRGDLRSGVYFIKVMIGDRELSKKIVLE